MASPDQTMLMIVLVVCIRLRKAFARFGITQVRSFFLLESNTKHFAVKNLLGLDGHTAKGRSTIFLGVLAPSCEGVIQVAECQPGESILRREAGKGAIRHFCNKYEGSLI